jgi:hypothetical protein
VTLLVIAFGYRAQQGAPLEQASGDVAGQLRPRAEPTVTRLGITRSRQGVRITLLRVERLDRGGRVYLKAVNGSDGRIAIPDTDIGLSQRYGKALPAPDPYVGRLPRFGPSIEPGKSATSVRYFPRLRRGGAVVEVQWFSGDPDLKPPGPMTFSFEVT